MAAAGGDSSDEEMPVDVEDMDMDMDFDPAGTGIGETVRSVGRGIVTWTVDAIPRGIGYICDKVTGSSDRDVGRPKAGELDAKYRRFIEMSPGDYEKEIKVDRTDKNRVRPHQFKVLITNCQFNTKLVEKNIDTATCLFLYESPFKGHATGDSGMKLTNVTGGLASLCGNSLLFKNVVKRWFRKSNYAVREGGAKIGRLLYMLVPVAGWSMREGQATETGTKWKRFIYGTDRQDKKIRMRSASLGQLTHWVGWAGKRTNTIPMHINDTIEHPIMPVDPSPWWHKNASYTFGGHDYLLRSGASLDARLAPLRADTPESKNILTAIFRHDFVQMKEKLEMKEKADDVGHRTAWEAMRSWRFTRKWNYHFEYLVVSRYMGMWNMQDLYSHEARVLWVKMFRQFILVNLGIIEKVYVHALKETPVGQNDCLPEQFPGWGYPLIQPEGGGAIPRGTIVSETINTDVWKSIGLPEALTNEKWYQPLSDFYPHSNRTTQKWKVVCHKMEKDEKEEVNAAEVAEVKQAFVGTDDIPAEGGDAQTGVVEGVVGQTVPARGDATGTQANAKLVSPCLINVGLRL